MLAFYKKMQNISNEVSFFILKDWTFSNDNVEAMWCRLSQQDQCLFNFSIKNFNWLQYMNNYVKGLYTYLLHNDIEGIYKSSSR